MKSLFLAAAVCLALCGPAFGWGLLTHVELAESLLGYGTVMATGLGTLLIRHRRDFMLGNLLADVVFAKKLSSRRRESHHWSAGWRLMDHAHGDSSRAFAYGFLTHLAADTVAHNQFVPERIVHSGSTLSLGHLYWELMADHLAPPGSRKTVRRLIREPSAAHEQLLEDHLYPRMKWYAFNRGMFTGIQRLAHGSKFRLAVTLCRELSLFPLRSGELDPYKRQAVDRMADLLLGGRKSTLLREDPNGFEALDQIRENRRNG